MQAHGTGRALPTIGGARADLEHSVFHTPLANDLNANAVKSPPVNASNGHDQTSWQLRCAGRVLAFLMARHASEQRTRDRAERGTLSPHTGHLPASEALHDALVPSPESFNVRTLVIVLPLEIPAAGLLRRTSVGTLAATRAVSLRRARTST